LSIPFFKFDPTPSMISLVMGSLDGSSREVDGKESILESSAGANP